MKVNIDLNENGRYFEIDIELKYYSKLYIYVEDDLIFDDNINTKNNIYDIYILNDVLKIIENNIEIKTFKIEEEFTIWFRNITLIYNNMTKRTNDSKKIKRISKRDYTVDQNKNFSKLKYIFDVYHEGQLIETVDLNSNNNFNSELKNDFNFEELVFVERNKPDNVKLSIQSYKLRNGEEIIRTMNEYLPSTYHCYLVYKVQFKNNNKLDININEINGIQINTINFKMITNGYNTPKSGSNYKFVKNQNDNEFVNDIKEDGSIGENYEKQEEITINEIIINNIYKLTGFVVKKECNFDENDSSFNRIYTVSIIIILDNNTTIIKLNNNNKCTKLLKLLKKHLNSRNTNINTLYHDLLKKMQQENTLIVTINSIININSLLKLLSEYLGINSKNPNVLYHSLLVKK